MRKLCDTLQRRVDCMNIFGCLPSVGVFQVEQFVRARRSECGVKWGESNDTMDFDDDGSPGSWIGAAWDGPKLRADRAGQYEEGQKEIGR